MMPRTVRACRRHSLRRVLAWARWISTGGARVRQIDPERLIMPDTCPGQPAMLCLDWLGRRPILWKAGGRRFGPANQVWHERPLRGSLLATPSASRNAGAMAGSGMQHASSRNPRAGWLDRLRIRQWPSPASLLVSVLVSFACVRARSQSVGLDPMIEVTDGVDLP